MNAFESPSDGLPQARVTFQLGKAARKVIPATTDQRFVTVSIPKYSPTRATKNCFFLRVSAAHRTEQLGQTRDHRSRHDPRRNFRPLPGTSGASRNSGDVDHPISPNTRPTPGHPKRGRTTIPPATLPVCAERSGIAPARPPGTKRIKAPADPASRSALTSRARREASFIRRNVSENGPQPRRAVREHNYQDQQPPQVHGQRPREAGVGKALKDRSGIPCHETGCAVGVLDQL